MRMKIFTPLALVVALGASGCSRRSDTAVNSASDQASGSQEVQLSAHGLTSGSRGLHHSNIIGFGQPRAAVEAQVRAALGAPTAGGRNADCPTGVVDYLSFGALDLHFEDRRFTGWVVDGPAPSVETYQGLSVGDRRNEISEDSEVQAVAASTLGTELTIDGVGVLVDGPGAQARVTTLFSGTTCFAR